MSKLTPAAIRCAPDLVAAAPPDRITACNVCGRPSSQLSAWRAHDEFDRPIAGVGALIFLGTDHHACRKALDRHPRLYAEERGEPGTFPLLCGPCVHRRGTVCPLARANGGPGITVSVDRFAGGGVIVCSRGACSHPVSRAHACSGREVSGTATSTRGT